MHQPAKSLGVTRYQIKDERGEVVAVHARENIADSDKQIWWERPDESLGLGGIKVADLPLFGVEYLAATTTDTPVIVTEGEPKQPVLSEHGFVAVGTVTGAKATPSDETLRPLLRFERVILWPDHDDDGRGHMSRIGERLRTLGHRDVRVLVWPEARDEGDDAVDFFARGGTAEQVVAMIAAAQSAFDESRLSASPWHRARLIGEFLADGDANSNWLDEPLLMRGAITHIFAPRGVGKSLICIAKAVDLSRAGLRVLYLDRDNSPSVIKKRFRAFGAGAHLAGLRVMTRTEVPPLTDTQAWANFPYQEYDLVIVDSLDAATEGVGEQDSAKVSRAIASILDIARRVGGPAFLIPGNTVKSGAHSRGSGVIEDRADIVFEVRDVTEFRPTGQKPWWEELPPAGRSAWAERATRRMGRMRYRLAFIGTKTRGDEEPEPFILEVDLSGNPYTIREVTATVTGAGDRAQREARARLDQGAGALRQEIERRAQTGEESMLADHDGVPFLQARGLTQKAARDLIADRAGAQWLVVERDGRSKILAPLSGQEASTAGDVTTPSGACIQTSADSATESANPREYSGCEAPNTVERMDTGQRNSGAQNPAPDAGIGIPWPISPYGPSTAPPPPAAVVTTKVSKEPPAPKPSRDEAEADLGDELPPWTAWLQGEKLDKAKARLNRAQAAWERNMGSADARRELDSAYAVFWPIKNAAASEPSLPVKTALITGASSATPEANRPLALGRLPKRQPVPPPEQATPEVTLGRVSKKQPVPPEPGRSDAGQP